MIPVTAAPGRVGRPLADGKFDADAHEGEPGTSSQSVHIFRVRP